jgi:hypothetical protein
MKNLLIQNQNKFYKDYKIIVVAGQSAGIGIKAIEPVKKAMKNPIETRTIALTCGKLTTGVTIELNHGYRTIKINPYRRIS